MQISSRFTLAVHIFLCIDYFKDKKMTSGFLAGSTSANPVVIRKILQQLKAAGLVEVSRGSGGAKAARPFEEITFLDIYRAVGGAGNDALFHFHEHPNPECPVGRSVHAIVDKRLEQVQKAMEKELAAISLADLRKDAKKIWKNK